MSCENNGIYGLGVLVKIPGLNKVPELKNLIFFKFRGAFGGLFGGIGGILGGSRGLGVVGKSILCLALPLSCSHIQKLLC